MASSRNKPVVIYDGDCKFCNRAVNFLKMKENKEGFVFLPSSDLHTNALIGEFAISPDIKERTIILIDKGRLFTKSDAVIKSIIKKGGFWKLAIILFMVPKKVRDAVYDYIASRRNTK